MTRRCAQFWWNRVKNKCVNYVQLTVKSTDKSVPSNRMTRHWIKFLFVTIRCGLIWLVAFWCCCPSAVATRFVSVALALRPRRLLKNRNIFVGWFVCFDLVFRVAACNTTTTNESLSYDRCGGKYLTMKHTHRKYEILFPAGHVWLHNFFLLLLRRRRRLLLLILFVLQLLWLLLLCHQHLRSNHQQLIANIHTVVARESRLQNSVDHGHTAHALAHHTIECTKWIERHSESREREKHWRKSLKKNKKNLLKRVKWPLQLARSLALSHK